MATKNLTKEEKAILSKRWKSKRKSIYNLSENIDRLKRAIHKDLHDTEDEKNQLTALVIRIMIRTSERVGNEGSRKDGHFGITQFKPDHISFPEQNRIALDYVGKSGVEHEKEFSDETCYKLLMKLKFRDNPHLFTTSDGFEIKPDRVNRYLSVYGIKSKDLRGFNSNRMMLDKLSGENVKEPKKRKKVFNEALRNIAKRIGHTPATLRKHYLLPEIEKEFYHTGKVKNVKID